MDVSLFDYHLPPGAIAQEPVEPRDSARLLCLPRESGEITHRIFRELPQLLQPGDCLVFNDTRVLPARLWGEREDTGGRFEVVLLHPREEKVWECLIRPGRRAKPGIWLRFGPGLRAQVGEETAAGGRVLQFEAEDFHQAIHALGEMPLPPYIERPLDDPERYQTIYSRVEGSAAAPTAGLHFTPGLMEALEKAGIHLAFLTLHVGLGTFRPVKVEQIEDHEMHEEFYRFGEEAYLKIAQAKSSGGRVIAVGTTVCRTLEAVATSQGSLMPHEGWTDIFIHPGYRFKAIDGLITNFHLPQSTLLMLISALAGRERILAAYEEALRQGYRFFSLGDAMLIL